MNEEERKAVEILNTFELRRKTKNYKEISSEDSKSVKIVLNLLEKLQKQNEGLKNQEATARKINELLVQRYSNSISLQKVKDKIEELLMIQKVD